MKKQGTEPPATNSKGSLSQRFVMPPKSAKISVNPPGAPGGSTGL